MTGIEDFCFANPTKLPSQRKGVQAELTLALKDSGLEPKCPETPMEILALYTHFNKVSGVLSLASKGTIDKVEWQSYDSASCVVSGCNH